ncbi:MAG: serine/threonine protein kinase, partial [Acidobacteriota bacterium]
MKWLLLLTAGALMAADTNWPQWRGPLQHGNAPTARNLPVQWSESEGLLWKTKMPSWSAATP